uniref:Ankyrin repeat and LEM domain-containing protein 2 n=1 Tax=Schistosoma haematobium TaxID=6185 RepID=A0A095A0J5_SCHHA
MNYRNFNVKVSPSHVSGMDSKPGYDSDDEFFDCQSEACFYAVASPLSKGQGEVFVDPKRAYLKLRGITGARLKLFANHVDANKFANTPVDEENLSNPYPPVSWDILYTKIKSPKADVESSPYPSASQQTLIRFRSMLDSGNVDVVKQMVDENPMILVTTSDTPTILQIRFRYNALHVVASKGNVNLLQFLLNCIDSDKFWERLYPGASKEASYWRQQYVLDLYLNSPELGNFETPLHFASKYGHIECVSMLARHPLTKLDPRNFAGHTPVDLAATRLTSQEKIPHSDFDCPTNIVNRILQIFDESYIVLADVEISEPAIIKTRILAPLNTREFQTMEMSGERDLLDKSVVVSPIVQLLKRLTFVSPMRWLRAVNQVDGDGQKSLTTDNIIPISDANSTTNKLVGYVSELKFSNKRRISASSIQSLDSPLEKPGGKKHSPGKTETKPTSELTTKQLPHYFTNIYKALPGNDDELKYFNPLELPLQKSTPSLVLSTSNNSKFIKCIQLTEYVQSFLNKSS